MDKFVMEEKVRAGLEDPFVQEMLSKPPIANLPEEEHKKFVTYYVVTRVLGWDPEVLVTGFDATRDDILWFAEKNRELGEWLRKEGEQLKTFAQHKFSPH